MPNKVLFCATVDYHFKAFHLPILKWFKEKGWEVHVAASGEIELPYVDQKFNIPIQRSPFQVKNVEAYQELKAIINKNDYKIIHCHTPMGSVLTRLAAKQARKHGTKVFYTAHGFHFCKGAPIMNWMLYYPIEKVLARYTDCLITINDEDYNLAISHRFKAGEIEHVHGIGVDTEQFKPVSEELKRIRRENLGYQADDFILFYAAEFNKNKNQQFLIKVMAKIKDSIPNARLLLTGEGVLQTSCSKLATELGVDHMVEFLGYRKDIVNLLPMCDIAVASSLREGLPVNIMEAMACGLPVVATKNRGHIQLVKNNENGFIVNPEEVELFSKRLKELGTDKVLCKTLGKNSLRMVKQFSLLTVSMELHSIYSRYMLRDIDETKDQYNRAYI
ncbi:glycosyltransferase family 4 protein [Metabacillus sediminilitoris]|uniref:Glycosyltransferase family 4 protein n=1 Tax=Metabacillus sediminilitoris TaxID=2567941 RepID=A0A4S4BZF0_9BACI|nr:glycosyltransferase family 4 protein [Metabacillus sediminilitoris]QGQ47230.1 glycosyltransferase [Metabacillus sediminilitoris]THF80573.1 glycosyltransferase family 4 protein [Metabacillus sediminilitoris]